MIIIVQSNKPVVVYRFLLSSSMPFKVYRLGVLKEVAAVVIFSRKNHQSGARCGFGILHLLHCIPSIRRGK